MVDEKLLHKPEVLETVDEFGTIKLDEKTTVNTERTGPAEEPVIPKEQVDASMSDRDRQLRNRPGMRSPGEIEAMKTAGDLPAGAPRESLPTADRSTTATSATTPAVNAASPTAGAKPASNN